MSPLRRGFGAPGPSLSLVIGAPLGLLYHVEYDEDLSVFVFAEKCLVTDQFVMRRSTWAAAAAPVLR